MYKRLGKFGLALSQEKTRVIQFTRFETMNSQSFTFLGFEFRWRLSRTGKPLVTMRTAMQKFRLALAAITKWIKLERLYSDTVDIMEAFRSKLQGHFNYYGVCGNMGKLVSFYHLSRRIVFKWLNRRSQRKSYNWRGFAALLAHFNIPRPRIIGYWN